LAISKARKQELVAQYSDLLARSQAIILTEYRALSVPETQRLRRKLQEEGAVFSVVKNTLFKLALQRAGLPTLDDLLVGPTAVGFCMQDVPSVAKAMLDFAKDATGVLSPKGGLLGDRVISAEDVKSLAQLPPREVVLAQVLGGIQAPASQIAGVVASGIRQILNVLQAWVDQEQKEEPAAA